MRAHLRTMLLVGAALFAAAPEAPAQDGASLRGTYTRDEAASDPMEKIVADGMSKLGKVYRVWPISGQAKQRLRETNRPYAWVQIVPDGDHVTVETPGLKLTTPRNGMLEDWEREKGDVIDVTSRLQGNRLEQTFDAEDGKRVNVYTLSPDGRTLNLDVTVTSPKLDSPLTYRMVYRRR